MLPDKLELAGLRSEIVGVDSIIRTPFGERLMEDTVAILDSHEPEPLPADVGARIDAIVQKAEEAFKEFHFIA